MAKKWTKEEIQEAKARLLELLDRGDTVYTVLRHVSRSGMFRRIDLFVIKERKKSGKTRPDLCYLSGYAEKLLGYRRPEFGKGEGLGVSGCGMDMGFHLVHELSYHLFKDGYALNHKWI